MSNDPSINTPQKDTVWRADKTTIKPNDPITLTWNNRQGLIFTKTITLDDKYMFTVEQSILNRSRKAVTLHPFALIARDGLPADLSGAFILHEGPIGYIDGELHELAMARLMMRITHLCAHQTDGLALPTNIG